MKTLTAIDLQNCLSTLGLASGMTIEVHSSLSSLGNVKGGAETVIKALKNIVTPEGTIVMPSFTLSRPLPLSLSDKEMGIKYKKRWLPQGSIDRSDMGIIPDTFRQFKDVHSGTGRHRFSAWGKNAKKYISGNDSFFKIVEDSGYGLLFGVGLNKLSSMHSVEYLIPTDVWSLLPSPSKEINKVYNEKDWFILTSGPYNNSWLKIQEICLKRKIIKQVRLNEATIMLFKIEPVINVYKEEIIKNPYNLFGIKRG